MAKKQSSLYMSATEQVAGVVFFVIYLLVLPFATSPLFRLAERMLATDLSPAVQNTIYYYILFAVTVVIFCASGVNFDEAIGAAVSAIGNVGISIGQFGPSGTYAVFPTVAKWVMSFVMLIGRLEIFTVLLLFTKALWRK